MLARGNPCDWAKIGRQLADFEISWEVWPEKIVTAFVGAGWYHDIHSDDIETIEIIFLDELASKFSNLILKILE